MGAHLLEVDFLHASAIIRVLEKFPMNPQQLDRQAPEQAMERPVQ